jgi:hypothetical protein
MDKMNDREGPMFTLSEASKQTGKSRTAIHKSITRGRVSATKNDKGEWQIDPAELFRVYQPLNGQGEREPSPSEGQIEALQRENSLLRDQLDDLREDRDQWRRQATALLTDQRTREGGLWSRLFGR